MAVNSTKKMEDMTSERKRKKKKRKEEINALIG